MLVWEKNAGEAGILTYIGVRMCDCALSIRAGGLWGVAAKEESDSWPRVAVPRTPLGCFFSILFSTAKTARLRDRLPWRQGITQTNEQPILDLVAPGSTPSLPRG